MWKEKIKKVKDYVLKMFHYVKINIIKFFRNITNKVNAKKLYKSINKDVLYYILRIVVSLIIITTTLLAPSINFKQEEKKEKKVTITDNKAEEYFYEGSYSKAIEEYNKILLNDKDNSWWEVKISEIYSVEGDIENSKKHIDLAKEMIVTDKDEDRKAKVLNYIVFTEFMNKDYKLALENGQEALKAYPKNTIIYKTMFTVFMANNVLKSASDLISNYPLNIKSAYDMAEYSRMLMIVGRWDEGLTVLRNAWNIDIDEYKIYDVLSQSYSYNKDTLMSKITALSVKNPEDIAYKMWLAKIYSLSVDTSDQANNILTSIGNGNAGKIEVNLIKASIFQNSNQLGKSDELLNSIIKQYPNDYRVLHTAGWYYLNKKDYSSALSYCKQSIVKNKDYPDNYSFLMPEILKAEGKSIEGEPYFRIALSKEPYNYNIMLNIANYYWVTSQNLDKAIGYFKLAEIIKPSDSEIKYSMANVYLNANKEIEAIDLLKQCIKIDASVPKYHRMLGTIYLIEKNSSEAIKEIKLAYQADQQDILTLSNAGCYYITFEADLARGLLNLQKASQGITTSTDAYTKEKINDNYSKAKQLQSDYSNGKSNDKLKIPEFTLFY